MAGSHSIALAYLHDISGVKIKRLARIKRECDVCVSLLLGKCMYIQIKNLAIANRSRVSYAHYVYGINSNRVAW